MRSLIWLKTYVKKLLSNELAMIDLPMRMLVSLTIGLISITVILSFLFQPALFDQEVIVTIHPSVAIVNETNPETFFTVTVSDEQAHRIPHAQVVLHGDSFVQSNMTDNKGQTTIEVNITIPAHQYETFADVRVKASGYQTFFEQDLIKIVYQ